MIRLRPSERHVVLVETECAECVMIIAAYPCLRTGERKYDGGFITMSRASADLKTSWTWRKRLAQTWRAWHRLPYDGLYVESREELKALQDAITQVQATAFPPYGAGEGK